MITKITVENRRESEGRGTKGDRSPSVNLSEYLFDDVLEKK